jgi:hypothetical protein
MIVRYLELSSLESIVMVQRVRFVRLSPGETLTKGDSARGRRQIAKEPEQTEIPRSNSLKPNQRWKVECRFPGSYFDGSKWSTESPSSISQLHRQLPIRSTPYNDRSGEACTDGHAGH